MCFRFWMLPSLVLKKMIMENFTSSHPDKQIIASVDFMVEKVNSIVLFISYYFNDSLYDYFILN